MKPTIRALAAAAALRNPFELMYGVSDGEIPFDYDEWVHEGFPFQEHGSGIVAIVVDGTAFLVELSEHDHHQYRGTDEGYCTECGRKLGESCYWAPYRPATWLQPAEGGHEDCDGCSRCCEHSDDQRKEVTPW